MRADPVSLLARLLEIRSTSDRASREIVDRVVELSGARDGEVTLQRYDDDRKANLLLLRGPARDDGEGLALSGHLDVVPADEEGWESDPWTLTDRGDRLVGRGACDMKGFLALALDRFRRVDASSLARPLALLFTSDEEVGSLGAQRWAAEAGRLEAMPRQVLIGEPTELHAVRLHKGHLRLRIDLHGVAAHSGYPHRGRNAIEPAGPALVALARLRARLVGERSEHSPTFSEVPFVALNVGRITGGVATNVIPDQCRIELGARLLPGMDSAPLVSGIRETLVESLGETGWELTVENDSPPLLTRREAPLCAALSELLGQREDVGASFASDGGALAGAGYECVLFGPGSIEVAHRANEFVPKADLDRAGAVLDDLIERFCGARPA